MRFSETPRGRELGACLGALLLHFVVLGFLRVTTSGSSVADATQHSAIAPAASDEFDIEVGGSERALSPSSSDANSSADDEASAVSARANSLARPTARAESPNRDALPSAIEAPPNVEPDATEVALAESEVAKSDATEARPSQPLDLGIGPDAWQKWARAEGAESAGRREETAPRQRRPLVRAPTPSKTGGLQEGLEARDRERGLGPSGRVMTALYQATHSEVAPQLGVAHFSITVMRSGTVEVSLTGANKESEKWRAVAARAASALRKSPPRIPPSRSGVRLTLDVVAEETYPNGVKPGDLHGPRLEVTPPVLESTQAAQAELGNLNPLAAASPTPAERPPAIVQLPGVYVTGKGKVCGYRAGLSALGPLLQGGCDLSNIGSKPQRMVRVAVQDQSFF